MRESRLRLVLVAVLLVGQLTGALHLAAHNTVVRSCETCAIAHQPAMIGVAPAALAQLAVALRAEASTPSQQLRAHSLGPLAARAPPRAPLRETA